MFYFQDLNAYKKAKAYYLEMRRMADLLNLDNSERTQLLRASLCISLNIAEGAGRLSELDKRRFYIISRGSVYECVAVLDLLKDQNVLNNEQYSSLIKQLEELSRIVSGLIRRYT
jgi:four helix bundle protein